MSVGASSHQVAPQGAPPPPPSTGTPADATYVPLGPGPKDLPPWFEAANPFQETSPGPSRWLGSMAGVAGSGLARQQGAPRGPLTVP